MANIGGLGRVLDTKFGMDISSEMLLNPAKCKGHSFDRAIKGKVTGKEGVNLHPSISLIIRFKALEIKTSTVINLVFPSNTILSCFLLCFLIINLYLLIPAVTTQTVDPTAELTKS